jgi:hypothetical protein
MLKDPRRRRGWFAGEDEDWFSAATPYPSAPTGSDHGLNGTFLA